MAAVSLASLADPARPAPATPRLHYFAGWGLAEQGRWILAAAGIRWDQQPLTTHEEFLALRDQGMHLAYGQLPLLEIDGLKLVQSQAIVRYVSAKAGLAGSTPTEAAVVDMFCEAIKDARGVIVGFPFAQNQAQHASEAPYRLAKFMPRLEAQLAMHGGRPGLLPSGLSAADVLLAELVEDASPMCPGFFDAYPLCGAVRAHVTALPGVQEYLSSDRRFPFPSGRTGQIYAANVGTVLGR
mmetsp:Transcript_20710/g.58087  ORF Transcript_20710/g.58087 Transcript_20710/m.58087 type:complete len:240 (-) Transcript_20710:44-763(-)